MKKYKVGVIFTGVITKEFEAENQKDLEKQVFSDFSVALIGDFFYLLSEATDLDYLLCELKKVKKQYDTNAR